MFRNLDPNIPIKVADNQQIGKGSFDSILRLQIHAIINETGQIYHEEKYILNEDLLMKLVREKK